MRLFERGAPWLLAIGCACTRVGEANTPSTLRPTSGPAAWGDATLIVQPIPAGHHESNPRLVINLSSERRCLVLGPTARAIVDDIEVPLVDAGGPDHGTYNISGIEVPTSKCRRAQFETTRRFKPRPTSRVTVVDGRREASLTAHWLFGPPPMTVEPARVRPGEPVTLELAPPDPSWPSYDVLTTIKLSGLDEVPTWIRADGFRWHDNRFELEMPEVPPGPVKITATPAHYQRLELAQCSGVKQCFAHSIRAARHVEVVVEPKPAREPKPAARAMNHVTK